MLIPIEYLTGNIDTAKDPLERLLDKEDCEIIEMALQSLDKREQYIVNFYFGFEGNQEKITHKEIGKNLGISGGRVQQLLEKALRQFRHPAAKKYLKQYVDRKMTHNFCLKSDLPAMHYVPEWKRPIVDHVKKYRYNAYYDFNLRAFLQGKMSTKQLTDYFSSKI